MVNAGKKSPDRFDRKISGREQNVGNYHIIETAAYAFLALLAAGYFLYVFQFDPVKYAILISEDQWLEYCTSVCFGLAGVLLMTLLLRPVRRSQKVIWAIIGLVSIFISAEEISWGQRIFYITTPEALYQINTQGELSLHNIDAISSINQHEIVAYMILAWLFISLAVSMRFPAIKNRMKTFGLPLVPIRLFPVFLLVPYFFLVNPIAKSDEFGELFLGAAALVWAIDVIFQYGLKNQAKGLTAVVLMVGMLILASIIAVVLSHLSPGGLVWRLNMTAGRDYPNHGMYRQAQVLYEYIYSHPQYLTPATRINHARMLMKLGKKDEAFSVLSKAIVEFEAYNPSEEKLSGHLRRKALVFKMLGQTERADEVFNRSVRVDRQKLELASDPDKQAELLWSIAKTLKVSGDAAAALDTAVRARQITTSQHLQRELNEMINSITEIYGEVTLDGAKHK